jgi:hypothetical protein
MAAQVRAKDVTSNQVVELITTSRSGSLGMQIPDEAAVAEGEPLGATIDGAVLSPSTASREDTP